MHFCPSNIVLQEASFHFHSNCYPCLKIMHNWSRIIGKLICINIFLMFWPTNVIPWKNTLGKKMKLVMQITLRFHDRNSQFHCEIYELNRGNWVKPDYVCKKSYHWWTKVLWLLQIKPNPRQFARFNFQNDLEASFCFRLRSKGAWKVRNAFL